MGIFWLSVDWINRVSGTRGSW